MKPTTTLEKIINILLSAAILKPFWHDGKQFSTRKFYAFILMLIAIADKVMLVLFPGNHYIAVLKSLGVDSMVIIACIASIDAFAFGALMVYGWKQRCDSAPATTPAMPMSNPSAPTSALTLH